MNELNVRNELAKTAFIATLDTLDVQRKFDSFASEVSRANSAESCTKNIATITDLPHSICGQSDIRGGKKKHRWLQNGKPWFDQECKEQHAELQKLGKMASREPKDSLIRKMLHEKKKSFKS